MLQKLVGNDNFFFSAKVIHLTKDGTFAILLQ